MNLAYLGAAQQLASGLRKGNVQQEGKSYASGKAQDQQSRVGLNRATCSGCLAAYRSARFSSRQRRNPLLSGKNTPAAGFLVAAGAGT